LSFLTYSSVSLIDMVFLTHPIQHIIAYSPIITALVVISYKFEFLKHNELNRRSNFIVLSIGIWIFLVFLRFIGYLKLYNNPDSGQLYGNFLDIFILLTVLTATLKLIQELLLSRPIINIILLSFFIFGFVKNQQEIFSNFPMKFKALPKEMVIFQDKLLIWDRDTADFTANTSNWLIHYTIPYSNTRWECSNYFPLLRTLPKASQINKITQLNAYEGVVKKASNYNNNYFNRDNSILLEDLFQSKTEWK
jgi:hypothetical protein